MNAIQNILQGVQEMARARELAEQKADAINEQEKLAQQAGTTPEEVQAMSPEQATEAINKLSAIVMDLTKRLDGKGESL
ncbi:hypothetical protein SporoP37_02420 [Sporosarcina sp. P37]|uniref:hypothetical protein n=1 Tax=unclassified Sporosarcina TaxID=2647733 RepID=UPI000A17EAB6|nr:MULTISPECIES: hypothetical protein [unclassified Sporosarcina]ARK23656.1 hypothetical protein SporoP37_02420 [Sporosarcina sp. P37]PID18719.1 hypothetical protein CSV62_06330 [Sporosarcina sp. P35]